VASKPASPSQRDLFQFTSARDFALARELSLARPRLAISISVSILVHFIPLIPSRTYPAARNAPSTAAVVLLPPNTYHHIDNISPTASPTWWARNQDEPFYGKKVSISLYTTGKRRRVVLRTLPPCAEQMLHLATHRLPSLQACLHPAN